MAAAVQRGASNRDIAADLFLSPKTVEFHLRQIYLKLGVHSRTQLIVALTRSGRSRPIPRDLSGEIRAPICGAGTGAGIHARVPPAAGARVRRDRARSPRVRAVGRVRRGRGDGQPRLPLPRRDGPARPGPPARGRGVVRRLDRRRTRRGRPAPDRLPGLARPGRAAAAGPPGGGPIPHVAGAASRARCSTTPQAAAGLFPAEPDLDFILAAVPRPDGAGPVLLDAVPQQSRSSNGGCAGSPRRPWSLRRPTTGSSPSRTARAIRGADPGRAVRRDRRTAATRCTSSAPRSSPPGGRLPGRHTARTESAGEVQLLPPDAVPVPAGRLRRDSTPRRRSRSRTSTSTRSSARSSTTATWTSSSTPTSSASTGSCVNEHHQNAYGLMPSPNIMAAALARRTERAKIMVLGNAIGIRGNPLRVAEEIAMLDSSQQRPDRLRVRPRHRLGVLRATASTPPAPGRGSTRRTT